MAMSKRNSTLNYRKTSAQKNNSLRRTLRRVRFVRAENVTLPIFKPTSDEDTLSPLSMKEKAVVIKPKKSQNLRTTASILLPANTKQSAGFNERAART
jgi:hypothetical protein